MTETHWHDAESLEKSGDRSVEELIGVSYTVLNEAGKKCGLYLEGAEISEATGRWHAVYKAPSSSELVSIEICGLLTNLAAEADCAEVLSNALISRCLDLDVSLPST
jgi:hypothetical protein